MNLWAVFSLMKRYSQNHHLPSKQMNVLAEYAVSRQGIIVQIGVVLVMIECALWTHGRTQVEWIAAALIALVLCVLSCRPSVRELGIGMDGMTGASVSIPIALAVAF